MLTRRLLVENSREECCLVLDLINEELFELMDEHLSQMTMLGADIRMVSEYRKKTKNKKASSKPHTWKTTFDYNAEALMFFDRNISVKEVKKLSKYFRSLESLEDAKAPLKENGEGYSEKELSFYKEVIHFYLTEYTSVHRRNYANVMDCFGNPKNSASEVHQIACMPFMFHGTSEVGNELATIKNYRPAGFRYLNDPVSHINLAFSMLGKMVEQYYDFAKSLYNKFRVLDMTKSDLYEQAADADVSLFFIRCYQALYYAHERVISYAHFADYVSRGAYFEMPIREYQKERAISLSELQNATVHEECEDLEEMWDDISEVHSHLSTKSWRKDREGKGVFNDKYFKKFDKVVQKFFA